MTPPPPPTVMDKPTASNDQGGILRVTVLTEAKTRLDRQAVVQLHGESPAATLYKATKGDSETTFLGLTMEKYIVEVSAVGYLSAQKEVEITGLTQNLQVVVTLQRDTTTISLDATGMADALMPAKASKDTAAAVAALKASNLKEARKRLNSAYKVAPESGRVNFLMGFLFFQQRDLEQAKTYLNHAITLSPNDAQALALLGRVQFLREQYEPAKASLERAVVADPGDWMSHNLLGSVYLKLKQYDKAREQAQIALDQGKADATSARLVLGEAQAHQGQTQEGIQTLKAFLAAAPASPQSSKVKEFIAELEQRAANTSNQAALTMAVQLPAVATGRDPLFDLRQLSIAWQPPGIDEAKPSVAAGVACPTEEVLKEAGNRVEELVSDVGRFAAIEDLLHERLDSLGNPVTRETRKFDYAAYISQPRTGILLVDEFRTERYGVDNLPDQIATSGFPALAMVFHPSVQGDYEISCEGLGEWHGQATWLMHFRAREDRPSHIQDYVVGKNVYPMRMKGRAWITADKFQIVRVESELIGPQKEIGFLAEHQIAEYGPVMFDKKKKKVELWLPKTAEVYLDFHRHRYYRRHSFDKYMLFSVDSTEKVNTAKQAPPGPGSTSPRNRKRWHA